MSLQLKIFVPEHPLLKHWLAVARDASTPPVLFKTAMKELGRWLTYEAIRYWLPTMDTTVQTPIDECPATYINPDRPIAVVPILRAGLALLDGAQDLLPLASTYHLGLVRDDKTLRTSCYLNKLPEQFAPDTHLLIVDPMLATGNSLMLALKEVTQRGINPELIRIVSVLAAPPGLRQIGENFPAVQIYAAMIDQDLNRQGFIIPGLGDAGDRSFGTE